MSRPLFLPRNGTIQSRGWMFLGRHGGPCDQRCQHCYYVGQTHLVFYEKWTLFQHANLFRHYYGLDAVDITGGEPTILPCIEELVAHCAAIGLKPSIITHGQRLEECHKRIEDAGLNDWRVSIHGTAEAHDKLLQREGSYERAVRGIRACTRPVCINMTLTKHNVHAMPLELLRSMTPTCFNIINFLPFYSHADKAEVEFEATFDEAEDAIRDTVQELEALGWEVNVRYWPFCRANGFERNVSGYFQVPYDPWEWRLNVTNRTPLEAIEQLGGWEKAENKCAAAWMKGRENAVCGACRLRMICDKPAEPYVRRHGLGELRPLVGELITDPIHFQREEASDASHQQ